MSRITSSSPLSMPAPAASPVSRVSRALVVLSAAGLLVLASGCASTASTATVAASSSKVSYCHKERLYTAGGDLVCNWSDSVEAACKDNAQVSRVATASLTDAPADSRLCPSGQRLVMATRK